MGQTASLFKLATGNKNCEWIYRFWANPGRPWGGIVPPSPVLAPESALGSRPRVALSSAQVFSESVPKALFRDLSPWTLVSKPISVLLPGQPAEHQLNHADLDLRFAGISHMLIVLAVNSAPTQPGKGPLYHPPPRQQLKPSVPSRTADDLKHIPPVLRDPSVQGVIVILGVCPELLQARERFALQLAENLRRRRIIHGCAGDGHGQEQPYGIHGDMVLPTRDPLGTVVTMLATPLGRLDGLAIDAAGTGRGLPTGSSPDSTAEGVIDGFPGAVSFPRREEVVDGPPWGEIVGQGSPDKAIAVAVEDGINHGPHVGFAWPPTGPGRRQEGLQDRPLLVCQITGVWLRVHTLSTFDTPFWNRLLERHL